MVGRLKKALRTWGVKRPKIGHGGTLDPLASGLLPVALGEATKLAQYVLDGRKEYLFTLRFGAETATDDAEGETVRVSDVRPTEGEILAVLDSFRGGIRQRPPAFSALKVDGRRAYKRARAGETLDMPERPVTIHALSLLSMSADEAAFRVLCSKGTYVRSLARDIARATGSAGHVRDLRRTGAARFGIADAVPLDKLAALVQEGRIGQALLPLTAGLDDIPVLAVASKEAEKLRFGQTLPPVSDPPGLYVATCGPVPVALAEVAEDGVRVVRGFNLHGGDIDVDHD